MTRVSPQEQCGQQPGQGQRGAGPERGRGWLGQRLVGARGGDLRESCPELREWLRGTEHLGVVRDAGGRERTWSLSEWSREGGGRTPA